MFLCCGGISAARLESCPSERGDLFHIVMEGETVEMNDHEAILASMSEIRDLTYRKILIVDLERDVCTVLRSDPEGWQPGEGPMTRRLARFALDGDVHWEDAERFVTFTCLDQLRQAFASKDEVRSMLYRRKVGDGYRWNLMEVIPDRREGKRSVLLCVKEVDDMIREGAEREGLAARSREVLRDLEDRAYIISSLSRLFFCTYYVDLAQDTFRAVTQLDRGEDVLGAEVNYTAALEVYADHFIHQDDRAGYLQTMSAKNLLDRLRWWQPCVAFEYRKLSEEPGAGADDWSWVRASAVLARAGKDDLPQTAVFVAQDITAG